MSDQRRNTGVLVFVGDRVESTAAGDNCGGRITAAREGGAWMWCVGCQRKHWLENPLHRFWRATYQPLPDAGDDR